MHEDLTSLSPLHVREAAEGDVMRGRYRACSASWPTSDASGGGRVGHVVAHLNSRPVDTLHRPSVDVMFQSAAETFRDRVLGVVMTGMGSDGKQGAAWIKSQGGLVYTESEETCVVYGMPGSVVEAGLSDRSLPLERLAQGIREVV